MAKLVARCFRFADALLEGPDALFFALPRFVPLAVDLLAQALELLQGLGQVGILLLDQVREPGGFFPLLGELAAAFRQAAAAFVQLIGALFQLLTELLRLAQQRFGQLIQGLALVAKFRGRLLERADGFRQRDVASGCWLGPCLSEEFAMAAWGGPRRAPAVGLVKNNAGTAPLSAVQAEFGPSASETLGHEWAFGKRSGQQGY